MLWNTLNGTMKLLSYLPALRSQINTFLISYNLMAGLPLLVVFIVLFQVCFFNKYIIYVLCFVYVFISFVVCLFCFCF